MLKIELIFDNENIKQSEIIYNGFILTEKLHNNLKNVDDDLSIKIPYNVEIADCLKRYEKIKARLLDENNVIFAGYLRNNFKFQKEQKNLPIQLEIVSPSFLIKKKLNEVFSIKDETLSYIIETLLNKVDLKLSNNSKQILSSINMKYFFYNSENINTVIEELLLEVGYLFKFNKNYELDIYSIYPEFINSSFLFNGENIRENLTIEKKEENYKGISLNYTKIEEATETPEIDFSFGDNEHLTIFSNTMSEEEKKDFLETNKTKEAYNYTISFPSDFFVVLCDSFVWQVKEKSTSKYINLKDHLTNDSSFEIDFINKKINLNLKIKESFKNNFTFTNLKIKFNNAFLENGKQFVKIDGENQLEKDLKHIHTFNNASYYSNRLANKLYNYYRFSDFKATLKSKDNLNINDIVKIQEYNSGELAGRIIEKKTDFEKKIYSYVIEGLKEPVSAEIINEEVYSSKLNDGFDVINTWYSSEELNENSFIADLSYIENGTPKKGDTLISNTGFIFDVVNVNKNDIGEVQNISIKLRLKIKGDKGADGESVFITSTEIDYQSATSGTEKPAGVWLNYIPAVSNGNFLWCRTTVNYSDGTKTESYSVSYIPKNGTNGTNGKDGAKGDKGDKGDQGIQGVKGDKGDTGDSGKGIKTITEYYLATSSGSGITTSTSGWTTTIQTVSSSKKYLWNYEKITYTDNSTLETFPVIIGNFAKDGVNGTNGTNGKGIKSVTNYYLASASSSGITTSTSGWTSTIQSMTATKKYLWNYETVTYTDNSSTNTSPSIIGVYGDKGNKGDKGDKGADGEDGISISINSTSIDYQSATSGTEKPAGAWLNYIPSVANGNYLWCRTTVNYSDGTKTESYSVSYIPKNGTNGKDGTNGTNGTNGKGIKSVTNYYLASASSSGITTSTSGWTSTIQTVSSSKKYLWNYEKITYTDNSSTNTSPVIIGNFAKDGVNGTNGTNGTNGKDGVNGTNGKDGVSISSVVEYYLATSSGSGITTSTSGWTTTIQTMTATKKYLWNYEVINFSNSTKTTTSPAIIGVYGDKGEQGQRGNLEFSGTEINHIGTTDKAYTITTASTGITSATMPILVGDTYINITTQDVWICSTAGTPITAKWKHTGRRCSDKDNTNVFRLFTPKTDYGAMQSTLSKQVVKGLNPFGETSDLLKITNTNGVATSNYSPNNKAHKIDPKKTYRYVAYIKQEDANYIDYFGLQGYRTSGQYIGALSTGTAVNSAYFTITTNFGTLGRWYMIVGYVVANGTTTAPADSGVYDMTTKQKVRSVTNFQWLSTATAILQMGTLIRYTQSASTKTGTAYLYDVRLDEIDGTEPTLNELLNLDTTTKSKGTWTASTVYNTGDIVYLNGNSYICIKNHTSETSFSTMNWNLIASKGDKGDKGAKGDKGDKGDKGATGAQGIQGIQGAKGDKGDKGDQGIQGVKGQRGGMYKGAFTSAPTSGIVPEDFYLNKNDGYIYLYNGSTWKKITDYTDSKYLQAINDMLSISNTSTNNSLITATNAHIENFATRNILANKIATQTINLNNNGLIKSNNFVSGESGFQIDSNGNAEFNSGRFRGGLGTKFTIIDIDNGYINNGDSFYLKNVNGRCIVSLNILVDNAASVNQIILAGTLMRHVTIVGGKMKTSVHFFGDAYPNDWDVNFITTTESMTGATETKIKLTYTGTNIAGKRITLIQNVEDIL